MLRSPCVHTGIFVIGMANLGAALAASDTAPTGASSYLVELGAATVKELSKPEFAKSRCIISPIMSTDGMTVVSSSDRTLSAGDVILAIDNEALDVSAKDPVRSLLMKHGPDETLLLTIRHEGKRFKQLKGA